MEQERTQEHRGPSADVQPETTDQLMKAFSEAKARVAEIEAALSLKDTEIASLKQAKDSLDTKAQSLDRSLAEAVSGYRSMVVQANPQIPAEMVGGDTVAAIAESLKQAKALVGKVRESLEADLLASRFPAGAPERGAPLLDLSPREKIRQGISK